MAFYDVSHVDCMKWSLEALQRWLTGYQPHVHKPSNTVYGGPLGVRSIIFVLSRIVQNLNRLTDNEDVPRDIRILQGTVRTWETIGARRIVGECLKLIHADVTTSMNTLRGSIQERSEAWERAIQAREEAIDMTEDTGGPEDRVTATCGVPMSASIIRSMANVIRERESDIANNLEDHEVSIIVDERLRAHSMSSQIRTAPSPPDESVLQNTCKCAAIIQRWIQPFIAFS